MKALVLSGGLGTRLRPLTLTRSKQLIPVANRPILYHVLDNVAAAGIVDVIIVTGANYQEIRDSIGDGSLWKLNISYAIQEKPLGLAHAVQTAANQLGNEDFIMYLGDNILPNGIHEYLRSFKESRPDALILLHPVRNPENFGIAVVNGERVLQLVEKPVKPPGNLGLVGIYFFTPVIHKAIQAIKPSARNELEITDAIQHLLESGLRVEAKIVKGPWHDAGKPEDLLEANHTYLQRMKAFWRAEAVESTLIGTIAADEETHIIESQIIGPVVIGRNCMIKNSLIGPFTSIGDGCQILSSGIDYSILMPHCQINHSPFLTHSIIGAESHVGQDAAIQRGSRLVIGDYSSVTLS